MGWAGQEETEAEAEQQKISVRFSGIVGRLLKLCATGSNPIAAQYHSNCNQRQADDVHCPETVSGNVPRLNVTFNGNVYLTRKEYFILSK